MQGGTFTISNGGVYGSLMSTPILNAPQSGILGMHKIQERPVAIGGKVEIRPMMYLALSYDHRIVDGREAVTFLVRVKECAGRPGAADCWIYSAQWRRDAGISIVMDDQSETEIVSRCRMVAVAAFVVTREAMRRCRLLVQHIASDARCKTGLRSAFCTAQGHRRRVARATMAK